MMWRRSMGSGRHHLPRLHGERVKECVAQLRMENVRALERGLVIVVWDFNYNPRRRGAETEVDQEVRLFVEEMRLQVVLYNGAPGPSHYPAPEGSPLSRIHAVYANPKWVWGATAGYMVGPEEMQDSKRALPHDGDGGREGGEAGRRKQQRTGVRRGGG